MLVYQRVCHIKAHHAMFMWRSDHEHLPDPGILVWFLEEWLENIRHVKAHPWHRMGLGLQILGHILHTQWRFGMAIETAGSCHFSWWCSWRSGNLRGFFPTSLRRFEWGKMCPRNFFASHESCGGCTYGVWHQIWLCTAMHSFTCRRILWIFWINLLIMFDHCKSNHTCTYM